MFLLGNIEVLPASIINGGVPQTPEQQRKRASLAEFRQKIMNEVLVFTARNGDLEGVRRICDRTIPGEMPKYCYAALREAIYAGHTNVAEYLAYRQPFCSIVDNDLVCCEFFWDSISLDEPYVFDFFIARNIDVHYVSKTRWTLSGDNGQIFYKHVPVNAMNFLRSAYRRLGESDSLKYMRDVLISRGVVDIPPGNYQSSGTDGCCEVQ
ncbi:MAG: hypothetical protein LBR92_01225 [Puniceicoccales bacterium]|nr:hypothetical protein [Puniceicoccales bacterium]